MILVANGLIIDNFAGGGGDEEYFRQVQAAYEEAKNIVVQNGLNNKD